MTTKPRRVRVSLENNEYILAPKWAIKDLIGIDEYGNLIIRETESPFAGQLTGLTACCNATAKGCDGYTGCRNCYREVESYLGAEMRESDVYLKVKAVA
jgi:hypothetical protein